MSILIWATGVALACMVLTGCAYCLRLLYGYRVRDGDLEILAANLLPVWRIRRVTIEELEIRHWLDINLFALRLGNRLTRRCVVVDRKAGVFRQIVITPPDPEDFVRCYQASRL